MTKRAPLYGSAPKGRYYGRDGDGEKENLGHAIFPIVTQQPSGLFVAIGTGFFVAEHGVFVTAAHVVEAVLDEKGSAIGPFGIFQFLPGGTYHVRPIHRATRHRVSDVAVGVAMPMHHNTTGEPMPNKLLPIAVTPPKIGSGICTYAYPKTQITAGKPQLVNFVPNFFDGQLLEHHPSGRDSVLLPGPCFRTSMVIHGGASGGPVVGPDGGVFAVNSTGYDDDRLSYVSCISEALDLEITGVVLPDSPAARSTSLRELMELGFVLRH